MKLRVKRVEPAQIALGVLLLATVIAAVLVPWNGALNVDNRTYLEMIDGIAHHGLPYIDNGPVARFVELRARWNVLHHQRLWGSLPPVFPYFAAPFYLVGGARLVLQLNIVLVGLLAWVTARLGRKVSGDAWVGVGAAWLTVLGAATWGSSLDTSPYGLALVLQVLATLCAWNALETPNSKSFFQAFLTGLVGALAVGTHLLAAPILAGLVAVFAVVSSDGSSRAPSPWASPRSLAAWSFSRVRDRIALGRVAASIAGSVVPLVPIAWLNHVRLGTFNPISYGRCVWRSCHETGLDAQGLGAMLRWFSPVFSWIAFTAVLLCLVRRSRALSVAIGLSALSVLALPGELHTRVLAMTLLAYGFVFDVGPLPLGFNFARHADGLGLFLGPFVIRSLVPMAPFTPLALLVSDASPRTARAAALFGLVCFALFFSLILRANMPLAYALSYPYISVRYVLPLVPFLAVFAAWVARRAGFGRLAAAGSLLLGFTLATLLWPGTTDNSHLRRELLLRVPLLFSLVAVITTHKALASGERAWRVASVTTLSLVAALSIGNAMGSDLRHLLVTRRDQQVRVDRIAAKLPHRFALIGFPVELDPVASLRHDRDLQYADLYETRDWAFVPLLRHWWAEGRPVFALHRGGDLVRSPWPEVRYEPVDVSLGVWRVVQR